MMPLLWPSSVPVLFPIRRIATASPASPPARGRNDYRRDAAAHVGITERLQHVGLDVVIRELLRRIDIHREAGTLLRMRDQHIGFADLRCVGRGTSDARQVGVQRRHRPCSTDTPRPMFWWDDPAACIVLWIDMKERA